MREPSDQFTRRALVAITVLLAAAIVAIAVLTATRVHDATTSARDQAINQTLSRVEAQAVLACRRQNITRATDNQAHLQNYQLYQFLIRASRRSHRRQPAATRRAVRRLEAGQRAATWTPLSDCTAPHIALRALSLNPIPFTRRLPPQTALNPANARQPDPLGSVS